MREASSVSRAPSLRDTKLPEPCPSMKPIACTTAITANDTPTAAVAWVLILLTKKVSPRL